jgi:hypothetical protein
MFKGAALFMAIFIAITPQSRTFLADVLGRTTENLNKWAPFSYIFLTLLVAAPVVSLILVKTWPVKEEPENPLAKYKNDVVVDD